MLDSVPDYDGGNQLEEENLRLKYEVDELKSRIYELERVNK